MELLEMIVTDQNSKAEPTTYGAYSYIVDANGKKDPYKFYAALEPAAGTATRAAQVVSIVMPLGGDQSGLYKFPRIGEKVLVAHDSAYYLMGYLPGENNSLYETEEENKDIQGLTDQEGLIFRYKMTGQNTDTPYEYSEVAFYKDDDHWVRTDANGNPIKKVHKLNIQSTGNIENKTDNYYSVKARRMDIDLGSAGVTVAELSDLAAGCGRINAKNKLTINADEGITLTSGRSTISISDAGVSISSMKSNFASGGDSSININPFSGLVFRGQRADFATTTGITLADGWGGSIKTCLGIVDVSGWQTNLGGKPTLPINLGVNIAKQTDAYTTNFVNIGRSLEDQSPGSTYWKNAAKGAESVVSSSSAFVLSLSQAYTNPLGTNSLLGTLSAIMTIIFKLFDKVLYSLNTTFTPEEREKLIISALVTELTYSGIVIGALIAKSSATAVGSLYGANVGVFSGNVDVTGFSCTLASATGAENTAPMAGLPIGQEFLTMGLD
ncbi:MAG: hypothetical protein LBP51_07500 [Deferribacteraceae bacterium]|jgi:hypothetical protein|nr:hypothetical protein [Deferribacteraceae bacterium]